jgi:hypothetical protein
MKSKKARQKRKGEYDSPKRRANRTCLEEGRSVQAVSKGGRDRQDRKGEQDRQERKAR